MEEREIIWREYGQTEIHPVAFGFTIVMSIALVAVPRAHVILPVSLVACLIPIAQRIVIATLDFSMIRLLLIVAWIRVFARGEIRPLKFNYIDTAFCTWLFAGTLIHTLREASVSAFVYRLGFDFDALGTYFLFRILLRDMKEVVVAIRQLAWISLLISVFMSIEWMTGRNLLSVFGGVNEQTVVRDGRLRCQGAFSHPIMAGSFGAGLAPLFLGVCLAVRRSRWVAVIGLAASTLITVLSASSGPLIGYVAGVAAWSIWPFRRRMRLIRYGMLFALVFLHLVREKPVWHLIGRVGEVLGAGTGYHRYALIDAFVYRFGEWWLLGTRSTAHWGWGLQDVTNQYVNEGVRGGFLTVAAFVAILVACFKVIGDSLKAARAAPREARQTARALEFLGWGMGAALVVHSASFMSVAYFGQMQVVFYVLLAFVTAGSVAVRPKRRRGRGAVRADPAASGTPQPGNSTGIIAASVSL